MIVEIPDQIINQSGLSAKEILLRVALVLFAEEKLTLGQASRLAGLHQYEFQKELAARNIPVHYGAEDFENDLQIITLKKSEREAFINRLLEDEIVAGDLRYAAIIEKCRDEPTVSLDDCLK